MLVVIPIVNSPLFVKETDARGKASDPATEWDEGTFYYSEQSGYGIEITRVVYNSVLRPGEIYAALYNNIGVNPTTQTMNFWAFEGYVNEYAFLSRYPQNRTVSKLALNMLLESRVYPNPFFFDTIGFFGLEGESLSLTIDDGAGGTIHTSTTSLETDNTVNRLVISQYHRRRAVIKQLDYPVPLIGVHVALTNSCAFSISDTVAISNFCAGVAVDAGLSQVGCDISMTQNTAARVTNNFLAIDAGKSVIKHSLIVSCPSDNLDNILNLYDGLAGVPTMYRVTSGFEYHWIYGMWTNFSFLYSNGDLSYYTVDIETATYPETLPDGYNMQPPQDI